MAQPLRKTLNVESPLGINLLLGINPKELKAGTETDIYTPSFIAALLTAIQMKATCVLGRMKRHRKCDRDTRGILFSRKEERL